MTGSLAVRRPVVRAPSRFDAGLAFVLAALALVDALLIEPPAEAAGLVVIGALVTTLPVAWRSVAPGSAAVVASLGLLLVASVGAADEQPTVTWFAPLIVVFALGEHGTSERCAGRRRSACWRGRPSGSASTTRGRWRSACSAASARSPSVARCG